MNIDLIAQMKNADEFFKVYQEGDEKKLFKEKGLLLYSLANVDPDTRFVVSSFLLDKGSDAATRSKHGTTTLHLLLSQVKHNAKETVELAIRLIQSGVDVNARDDKDVSIFQDIVNIGIHERDLELLYDEIFKQPNLEFKIKNFRGFTPVDLAVNRGTRPKLLERMKQYEERNDR